MKLGEVWWGLLVFSLVDVRCKRNGGDYEDFGDRRVERIRA